MKRDLSTLSLYELQRKAKTLKIANSFICAMLIIIAFCGLFLTVRKGVNTINMLPLALLPIIFINSAYLKKFKAEISARDNT